MSPQLDWKWVRIGFSLCCSAAGPLKAWLQDCGERSISYIALSGVFYWGPAREPSEKESSTSARSRIDEENALVNAAPDSAFLRAAFKSWPPFHKLFQFMASPCSVQIWSPRWTSYSDFLLDLREVWYESHLEGYIQNLSWRMFAHRKLYTK